MDKQQVKELFGKRLQQARKMEGLSLRVLSDKIGGAVSHNALAKYERGEMFPDSTLLISLARALNQPQGFFFRPMETEIQEVKYRIKKEKVGAKELESIHFQAQDYFERYRTIESILGEKPAFRNPLTKAFIAEARDIEQAAVALRKAWKLGLQPIGNLMEVLEINGVLVCEIKGHEDFDGFSGWLEKSPVVVINAKLNDQCLARKRHTLMHELGHLLLKDHIEQELNEEKVVAHFAGAFILPEESARDAFGGYRERISLNELIEMKVTWGISLSSLMMRANQLELISKALYRRFWDTYTKEEWKKKEPGDDAYKGQEESHRFRRLVFRGLGEGRISHSKASSLLNCTLDELNEEDLTF